METNDLRRQIRTQVQALAAAGVEWLPQGPPLTMAAPVERETVPVPGPVQPTPAPVQRTPGSPAPPRSAGLDIVEAAVEAGPALSLEERRQGLAVLAEEVKKCRLCAGLAATRTQTVFADGQAGAELCFVGEAPGADEDAQGLPFVGAAGQLLNNILAACGLKRAEVYICNILKCRPPGNRPPLAEEAAHCRPFLERQIDLVRPKFIVALGGCAASNLLNTTQALGKLRGRFHDYRGIPLLVTYHPAFLLPHRHPEKKREVWEDMKMLLAKMGREIPGK